jgi:hypothetical protein
VTPTELQNALRRPYDRGLWLDLLPKLLPTAEIPRNVQPLTLAETEGQRVATSAVQIARIPLADGKSVAVLEIKVAGRVDLQRNRVGLRNLVAGFIDQDRAHAVLGLFYGQGDDYRLSFVARGSEFSADGELSRTETEKRRYTYMLGRGQACRTPAERLGGLRAKGRDATLDDILKAFKVEPLFTEFFTDYGRIFDQVENLIRPTLPEKEPLRLFTQRLFNRLMFLAFIQRKGWLRWEKRTDYLDALWDARQQGKNTNFYRNHIVPLFFEGLNQPDRPADHTDPRFGSVPYLNGGLFEHADDGSDDRLGIVVPDTALDAILSGLFARYNFTAAESTPLDVEVAVDPEMLGKVFEELVTGRHEQGSYYTPKPIVSFMCRETLVSHLASRCEKETRADLEAFVHDHQPAQLRDAEAVLHVLRAVTVCDLACGSGAYLLGMLHELLELRTCLFATNQKLAGRTAHERKLEIIERNLYGVDKDPFAVNIARLRLWLSLAVEYDGSHPPPALPNLDFKIEQGDSLAAPAPADVLRDAGSLPLLLPTVRDFALKKARFLTAHGTEKEALRKEISTLKQSLKTWLATDGPADAFHWALEFAEVFLPIPAVASLTGGLNLGLELAPASTPGGFDIIVANPPYVRQELISPQKPILRKRFKAVFSGVADLFVFFYARAHELLRDGGTAAFISSNKWLRAGYGEALRRHLLDDQSFEIVMDFGSLPVFESATAYPCIFIWRKEPRDGNPTHWAQVKDLQRCYEGVRKHFLAIAINVPAKQFGKSKPRLASTAAAEFHSRIIKNGVCLGDLVGNILNGVKTGLNDAFVITAAQRQRMIEASPQSAELIRPHIVGDDIRKYGVESRQRFLLTVSWNTRIEAYPAIRDHLLAYERALRKRDGVGVSGPCPWFALSRPRPESHLAFQQPKIVFPVIAKELRFAFDPSGAYPNDKVFSIPTSDYFILACLNSSTVWLWAQQTLSPLRGGFLEFRDSNVRTLPIPSASRLERAAVTDLAARAQALHGQRRARVERFLRDLGVALADSNSRNPLEQPWTLPPAEFAKRAKPLQRAARERPQLLYEAARDETAALTEQIAKLEAEIDARVATLYGLDAEDQRWAAQAAPATQRDDKQALFFRIIGGLKEKAPYFPLKAIQGAANDAELALKNSTLKGYLVEAVAQGLLHDAGRGWYSGVAGPFKLNSKPVAGLVKGLEKAFPLLDFTCWSTEQISGYGHHLLGRFAVFVHTERDALESVAEQLRGNTFDVAINPRGSAARAFTPGIMGTVVIRPRTTTQPHEGHLVTIEGLLVELFLESKILNIMDMGEYLRLLGNLAGQHRIQLASLLDYARERRPAGLELIEHINADFLKNSALDGSK